MTAWGSGRALPCHGYGKRIDQLMRRLVRLRRRLHAADCPPSRMEAIRARMAWLHAAIFALSGEIDCGY